MAVTSPYDELTPESVKASMLRDIENKGVGIDVREGPYANIPIDGFQSERQPEDGPLEVRPSLGDLQDIGVHQQRLPHRPDDLAPPRLPGVGPAQQLPQVQPVCPHPQGATLFPRPPRGSNQGLCGPPPFLSAGNRFLFVDG